jgi:hypothetical protein
MTGTDETRKACWNRGTGTITTAGDLVLGTGTKFTSLRPGWRLRSGGQERTIVSIGDDASVKVDSPFSPAIGGALNYEFLQPVAGQMWDVAVTDNLFVTSTNAIQILRGPMWTWFSQNTFVHRGMALVADVLPASSYFHLRANLFTNELGNGIKGSGTAEGIPTLAAYFPGADVSRNVLGNEQLAALYPPGNLLAPTTAAIGMVDAANGNYALGPSSPYLSKGLGGRDPGADIPLLGSVRSMVTSGAFNPLAVPRYP